MCCSDPVDHHTYFIPGLYAAKVNLQWVYPLYTCGEGVAKGHRFYQRLRFSGVKGYRVPLSIEPWNKSRATVFSWAIRIHKFKKVLSYQICS
jgi:hypothetical protein